VSDGLCDGRKLRYLPIVDDCSRECLVIEVDTSLTGRRVVAVLERLADLRGLPLSITVDHGPEFEGQVLDAWAYQAGVRLNFIRPGKPIENAYIESWRIEYNTVRPHSSLGNLTPEQYAMTCVARANEAESKTADLSPGPY
jgi:putative transposase